MGRNLDARSARLGGGNQGVAGQPGVSREPRPRSERHRTQGVAVGRCGLVAGKARAVAFVKLEHCEHCGGRGSDLQESCGCFVEGEGMQNPCGVSSGVERRHLPGQHLASTWRRRGGVVRSLRLLPPPALPSWKCLGFGSRGRSRGPLGSPAPATRRPPRPRALEETRALPRGAPARSRARGVLEAGARRLPRGQ